jgi:hypothetical protein
MGRDIRGLIFDSRWRRLETECTNSALDKRATPRRACLGQARVESYSPRWLLSVFLILAFECLFLLCFTLVIVQETKYLMRSRI